MNEYLNNVKDLFKRGNATEHSYRGDLQRLIENLVPDIKITNEPKRIKCGSPDYILSKKDIPVGYIEAKDVGKNLSNEIKTEQLNRYKKSLGNLILTDYIEFKFIRYEKEINTIKIAEIKGNKIVPLKENFNSLVTQIKDFCSFKGQTIKSSEKLAKMMAQKARMMEEVIFKAINTEDEDSTLREQLEAFRKILIPDLSEKDFADIYAQTISYGLFAARLHDETLEDFSRQEARDLIPKSNPFLRNLFDYITGAQLDDRIVWIVDDLAEIFRATNIKEFLKKFDKSSVQTDPFIHFYETFLAEYDPKLRRSRGVYYTPEPVVKFIVRAVDDILKTDFGLVHGIADTKKINIDVKDEKGKKKGKKKVHKVQILDPAVGTGTFLAEIVKQIYAKFENQKGIWSSYVESELLPRLNGFEVLMAPYTMCHLKLEVLLMQTGYKSKVNKRNQRIRAFLTNSLEEVFALEGSDFSYWLSKEVSDANNVKKETPVMVLIGNPPYRSSSTNKGEWILKLIEDYKKDLNEKKINIDDDYIKFIRYGQYFIEKNSEGILAYITNNSFLDGITHRQMRKCLLETFNKIIIINLHGDVKKKETSSDGSKDENVFDIQQGVSINLFIKSKSDKKNGKLGEVFYTDLYGKKEIKYEYLRTNSINNIKLKKIKYNDKYFFFIPKDFKGETKYKKGFSLKVIFNEVSPGIKTERDKIAVHFKENSLDLVIKDFHELSESDLREKYNLYEDSRDWGVLRAKQDIIENYLKREELKIKFLYRQFDERFTIFTGKSRGFIGTPGAKINKHFIKGNNIGLVINRQSVKDYFSNINITDKPVAHGLQYLGNKGQDYLVPLYLYTEKEGQKGLFDIKIRNPNLNLEIVNQISENIGLIFTSEKEGIKNTFAPIDILDYIYAVLHSPSYREKYKEFLKIDFPRVPFPEDKKTFWKLVKHGEELRKIHLLENPVVEKFRTSYPVEGDNVVSKIKFEREKKGRVWINDSQYFDKVPEISWGFFIGGYQPAQKWLKDRKGRELSFEDISHYQKIIVALYETDRIMKEINKIVKY